MTIEYKIYGEYKMKKSKYYNVLAAVAVVFALAAAACTESMTEQEQHPEAEGVQLIMSGNVIASYDGDTQSWTGELEVDVGEETPHIRVVFVDHDGNAVELEADTYLEVGIGHNKEFADFEQDTPGEFGGHLHGIKAGVTDATFMLMHGAVGSGHADFVTTPVHVHVHDDHG